MPPGIRLNVPLSQYTTLHIGGVADYLCEVETVEELKAAGRFAQQTDLPLLLLGGGSNVLIADEGFRGLVIINRLKKREIVVRDDDTVELHLGAGEILDDVVAWSVSNGWWGLENLSAIPGTVGATPVQNVGAYGVEVSQFIVEVTAVHRDTQEEKIFSNNECDFSYRDSFFKSPAGKQWSIVEVVYLLSSTPRPQLSYADLAALTTDQAILTPQNIRDEIIAVRSKKFPDWSVVGTAGSFFKNPIIPNEAYNAILLEYPALPGFMQADGQIKVSLGFTLDKICNLRGYCEGSVCLFEKQALVLVAHKGATASEIKHFVQKISDVVFEKTKIKIECEVQFI